MEHDWLMGLVGGLLIGAAATFLWGMLGRVAAVSGIIAGGLFSNHSSWRWGFIAGLCTVGGIWAYLDARPFADHTGTGLISAVLAGLLVGFGARLGSGCTSGHGVCGLSRFSIRSAAATGMFMLTGMVTVYVIRHLVGSP